MQLLRMAGVTNFVISDELTSMITVQLARNPNLHHFWIDNIFKSEKSEFAIVRVDRYLKISNPSFLQFQRNLLRILKYVCWGTGREGAALMISERERPDYWMT